MIPKLALTGLIALALCAPVQEAAAQDAVGGAIAGGVLGGIVGGALGGGRGAAVGAIVGAGTGAAIAAQGEPRPGGYRYYQNGCCQTVQYAPPPQRYYDDTPRCMRSPTYDPRSGTFVGRDGYRYACP
jgi:uncharacterized protein YcfJ